ncbi:MAG: hypothetical protein IT184_00450 [Acidobacteria bacterium]|nr:hypothetical protein [Acidobacteriota bacterium]
MGEINVRADAIDVEQIMRQIRARIREKRGVDYTEAELQQLAQVKLETFLDPRGVRSDLVERFRAERTVAPAPPNYEFEEDTLFETHRGPLRALRRLLRPILKLFFNPDKITSALHVQARVNTQAEQRLRRLEDREPLYYELIHNLTVEVTRLGIETHNLRMRVESLSSRLDFDERRARSLESTVQFKPQPSRQPVAAVATPAAATEPQAADSAAAPDAGDNASGERRRRRRRRRRRPGRTLADGVSGSGSPSEAGGSAEEPDDRADGDDGPDGGDGPDDADAAAQ